VPKYDAFGREIGEDTLQGLGGSPTPAPAESAWETRTERDEATWQAAERVEVARQQAAADAADVQAERTEEARQDAAGASRYTATPDPQRTALAAQLSGVLSQAVACEPEQPGTTGCPVPMLSPGVGIYLAPGICHDLCGATIRGWTPYFDRVKLHGMIFAHAGADFR